MQRIHKQYRKFLELWQQPKIRASMMGLQGYRPQDLACFCLEGAEWKELVLKEMKELAGNGGIHPKIVEFVDSL